MILGALYLLNAEENECEDKKLVIYYGGASVQKLDYKNLNNKMKKNGFKKFDENVNGFFFRQTTIEEKNVFTGEFSIAYSEETKANKNGKKFVIDYENEMNLMIGYGRILYENDNFKFYPVISGGYSQFEMTVTEKDKISFDDALADPKREITFEKKEITIDIGVQFDYLVKVPFFKRNKYINMLELEGLAFGLRAGYTFGIDLPENDLFSTDWETHAIDITGGPGMKRQGPYVAVEIGAWKWDKED